MRTNGFEAVVSSANDAIITADDHGEIVSWNPAAARIFGYTEEEALGQSLTLIIPERFHEQHTAGHRRVVETGETRIIGKTVEVFGRCKGGLEIPIELSLATWRTDGRPYFSAIIRDIRERMKMMADLKAAQDRTAAIVDSANDAIITIDHTGTILLWNQYAATLFGRSAEEMIGSTLEVIIPERFHNAHRAGIKRVASGGEQHVIGHTVELVGVKSNGDEFPIELSLATWTTDDSAYFSGIIRDISERKAAEKLLHEANAQLAEKNEMLESLSGKLAKYLSKQVYDSIFSGRTDVKVESYRKRLTVFFSDIQGFTELTDRMEAEPLSQLLNSYLSEMAEIAEKHGGTVDKFIGDGIMIFFGDPESKGEDQDAKACIRMALEMRQRVDELRKEWVRQSGSADLHVRMGINTGWCTVGNFGSENRMDYTIVGKEVNAASRLESAAGTDQINISDSTYTLIQDEFECLKGPEIKVKGLAYPIQTHQVLGLRSSVDRSSSLGVDISGLDAAQRAALLRALAENATSGSPSTDDPDATT